MSTILPPPVVWQTLFEISTLRIFAVAGAGASATQRARAAIVMCTFRATTSKIGTKVLLLKWLQCPLQLRAGLSSGGKGRFPETRAKAGAGPVELQVHVVD